MIAQLTKVSLCPGSNIKTKKFRIDAWNCCM